MLSPMNLEAIAALTAAAAATIAVPASLLVGRWTTRAAQEAAKRAEDAQRAQWVRSTRREAYAAFMVSAMELRQIAEDLSLEKQAISREEFDTQANEFRDALRRNAIALAVVRLEGPESEVAKVGKALHETTLLYWLARLRLGSVTRARAKLEDLQRDSDPEIARKARELDEHLHQARRRPEGEEPGDPEAHTQRARVLLQQLQDKFLPHESRMLLRTTWGHLENPNRLAREVDAKSQAFAVAAHESLP